jgi:hypothetical protein
VTNEWASKIEEIVYNYIDDALSEEYADYDDFIVTDKPYTGDTPVFPVVYVHEMSQREIGNDIDGSTIVGVETTFQIEVAANEWDLCKEISKRIVLLMKELRFRVMASPLYQEGNGYTRSVSRYGRTVGGEDVELLDIQTD